jgi:hypothetical protein
MYASKRLQKVVADYRKQKAQGQQSSSTTGSSSEGETGEPVKKKSRTAGRSKGKTTQTRTKNPAGRGKGRKGKAKEVDGSSVESDAEDPALDGSNIQPTAPLSVELRRPRPKPRLKQPAKPNQDAKVDESQAQPTDGGNQE